jgi:hypothetical protein
VAPRLILALPAALLVLAVPLAGAASGRACSPLTCNPSQFALARGNLLAFRISADKPLRVIDLRSGATRWRLPPGVVAGDVLVHQDGALLTWFDLAHGTRIGDAALQSHARFALVGVSQDGRRAVLARTEHRTTTFAVVSRSRQRQIRLPGNRWSFDALSGNNLFLVHTLDRGYEIRLYDLANGGLAFNSVKGPDLGGRIWGDPWQRVSSPDGRYLFTLYVASNGASMVHELDLRRPKAHCVDLPGTGNWNAAATYALALAPDGRHLWVLGTGYGQVAELDIATHRIVESFRFDPGPAYGSPGVAAMASDGARIALTDAYHVWLVDTAHHSVVAGPAHVAIGLAWSPDARRLWVVGERSRVSPLRLR